MNMEESSSEDSHSAESEFSDQEDVEENVTPTKKAVKGLRHLEELKATLELGQLKDKIDHLKSKLESTKTRIDDDEFHQQRW